MLRRLLILDIILLLGVATKIALWIIPDLQRNNELNARITASLARLEYRYANRQILRRILGDLERLRDELPTLRRLAVPEGQELGTVTTIEELAERHALTHELRLTQPTAAKPSGYERELGVEITTKGSFQETARFLEDLERLPQVFLKPRLTITARSEDGKTIEARYAAALSWPHSTD